MAYNCWRRPRRLGWIGLFALTELLAACGSTTPAPSGVVTGIATPCVGLVPTEADYEAIAVRVTISDDSQLVASESVRGSHAYRIAVAPGRYVVSSNAVLPRRRRSVRVKAGEVVVANLWADCM
jgi:hypothetical protein